MSNSSKYNCNSVGWFPGGVKIGGDSPDSPDAQRLATEEYVNTHSGGGNGGTGADGYSIFEFFGDLCVLEGNKFSGDLFSVSNYGREVRAGDWLIYGTKFMKITSVEDGGVDATVICDLEGTPNLSGYATETFVETAINEALGVIENGSY